MAKTEGWDNYYLVNYGRKAQGIVIEALSPDDARAAWLNGRSDPSLNEERVKLTHSSQLTERQRYCFDYETEVVRATDWKILTYGVDGGHWVNPRNPRNAGRKPIGDNPREKTLLTLDSDLKAQAKAAATDKGISLSQLVNDLLSEHLTTTDK